MRSNLLVDFVVLHLFYFIVGLIGIMNCGYHNSAINIGIIRIKIAGPKQRKKDQGYREGWFQEVYAGCT